MKKILIANRGEIALRIIRSVKEMGIETVAVFSEADRNAPFVRIADEAVCIGPPSSKESYLKMDKIVEVAQKLNVDGIHPGYGFLSENAKFSKKVNDAGITFIGPSPEAIEMMGDKLAAKKAVSKYNIPMLPGIDHPISNVDEAKKIASDIGFPVLIKAAAGGGGKGMRTVHKEEELESQLKRAISEAESAFGDGSVFIEKYITSPKHIEIQILSDTHGHHLYLFERDCSIQRRHQKVIEEAPSGILSPEQRKKMGESAIGVAKSCNYTGAGTVEFLVDENLNYYFLEMNTRLQVEHPVTEMVTGLDLVKEQVLIAKGEPLRFKQEDLKINGHAIELRVYAEDPTNQFLPDTGKLLTYRPPDGPGVRVDSGYEEDMTIPVFYDPMIAKLAVHAKDRQSAIDRLVRAIEEFEIEGISTTLQFGKYVIQHPEFRSAKFTTHFVDQFFDPDKLNIDSEDEAMLAAALAAELIEVEQQKTKIDYEDAPSPWFHNRK